MPSYQEFVYQGNGKTRATPIVDTRTLAEAKAERLAYIDARYKKQLENGTDLKSFVQGRAAERGVSVHDLRNASLGRGNALQNTRILAYDAALYNRKSQLETLVSNATTNTEVDAISVTFDDITYSG